MYKLTVVICVYNEEISLLKALRSLGNNNIYPYTEIIVIDDNSSNPITLRLLHLLERFTKIKIIYSLKNLGLSNSRNQGFINATTNYVLPLDADDILPEGTLDEVYQTFIDNPEIDFIAGNYFLNDLSNDQINLIDCSAIATNNLIDIKKLAADWRLLGTSPCKKTTWEKVGGYSLKYSYSVQDVDFWIRVLELHLKGFYLNKPIYIWNKSKNGMNMKFDRFDIIKLLDDHKEFYLLNCTKKDLYNKIFEGYYPYKQKQALFNLGKNYFFYLTNKNKIRLMHFWVQNLFNKEAQYFRQVTTR